jgi:leucyl aminopeptidase
MPSIGLLTQPPVAIETDALVLLIFSRENGAAELHGALAPAVDAATQGWIQETLASGEFSGKSLETALLHRPAGLKARRLLLVGAGKQDKFDAAEMRKAAGTAARVLKSKGARNFALALGSRYADAAMLQAATEGILVAAWESDKYKTDPKKDAKGIDAAHLAVNEVTPEMAGALEAAYAFAEGQNFARALVNEPANLLTPLQLAAAAREMAEAEGLECTVLDRAQMQQLGMGSLLGVAQGSAEPPCLIVLRYRPAAARTNDHLALIGKGVTFDTGGVSIKPADGMEKMKYDMAGAASVIGAMQAIARLKPGVAVTAFAPCVENMVGGRAQRPGDIVTSMNGKTVEVLNTDAEGRLILIDAFTYAIRQGCTHLVDAATLTGAVAVALASVHAGLFSNDEALRDRLLAASRAAGEKLWPMPLDEEYREMLKSPFADIPNITGVRYGGAITAAKFLEEFVEGKPWVHLDIAGTAWVDDGKPWLAKGPSGLPVRTFVRLALDWT